MSFDIFSHLITPKKNIYSDSNAKISLQWMKTILRKLYAEIEKNVSDSFWENEL